MIEELMHTQNETLACDDDVYTSRSEGEKRKSPSKRFLKVFSLCSSQDNDDDSGGSSNNSIGEVSTREERARRFIILKMRYVVSYKMCCTLYFIGILRCVQQGQRERERIKGRKMRKNCQLCITMASLMFNNRSNSQKKVTSV